MLFVLRLIIISLAGVALPAKAQSPKAVNWSGLYVGAHLGVAKLSPRLPAEVEEAGFQFPDDRSVVGGLKLGTSYQFQSLVLGLEADATRANLDSRLLWADGTGDYSNIAQVAGLASLRARVGVALESAHVYATGGAAYGMASLKFVASDYNSRDVYKDKTTVLGFVYGGGVEWRLNDRYSMNVEALRYRLEPSFTLDGERGQLDMDLTTVRAGLTFHFR